MPGVGVLGSGRSERVSKTLNNATTHVIRADQATEVEFCGKTYAADLDALYEAVVETDEAHARPKAGNPDEYEVEFSEAYCRALETALKVVGVDLTAAEVASERAYFRKLVRLRERILEAVEGAKKSTASG